MELTPRPPLEMIALMTDLPAAPGASIDVVLDRPRLHIHPERGWLNDPNGVCRIDGTYHVFFQYNPAGHVHDDIHWGHVSSPDLLHWTTEPVALAPSPDGPDWGGCWSGCIVDDGGVPTAVYTGIRTTAHDAGVTLSRSDRTLRDWTGDAEWRVGTPEDPEISDVRDPFVFTHEGRRYAVQGAGRFGGSPQLLLYGCDDLTEWSYLGPLLTTDDPIAATVAAANIWECPNLFQLGGSWVLLLSLWRDNVLSGVRYLIGDLVTHSDGLRFFAQSGGPLDAGPTFYAPQALVEADRVLLWAWAWEGADRSAEAIQEAGWCGTLTSPREVVLSDGEVSLKPAGGGCLLGCCRSCCWCRSSLLRTGLGHSRSWVRVLSPGDRLARIGRCPVLPSGWERWWESASASWPGQWTGSASALVPLTWSAAELVPVTYSLPWSSKEELAWGVRWLTD